MDSTHFDAITVSSDSSLPHTPSPRNSIVLDHPFENVKPRVADFETSIFPDAFKPYPEPEPITHAMENPAMWSTAAHSAPFFAPQRQGSTGSLLQELHGQDYPEHLDAYSPPPLTTGSEWGTPAPLPHPALPPHMQQEQQQHVAAMSRRASFGSIRSDREDMHPHVLPPFMADEPTGHYNAYGPRDSIYAEPLGLNDAGSPHHGFSADPSALQGQIPHLEEAYLSPHHGYREMDDSIKLEDASQVIVPSQHIFYPRPPSQVGHLPPMPMYMAPHAAIPIQHTDDAASKETQYLRRRCFNCHTTEPPSWRRSTLNPGKIVCNKCGLYERTHLRPRPQRFDELRAGNKARKHTPKVSGSTSPKESSPTDGKAEGSDNELEKPSMRPRSISGASVQSASSDLDDSVSVYSSTGSLSGAESYANSPAMHSFAIANSPGSSTENLAADIGNIRLPSAPFSEIAPHSPRKAATTPNPVSPPHADLRRGSMPVEAMHRASPLLNGGCSLGLPEVTGWQSIPLEASSLSRSSSRNSMVA